MKQAPGKKAAVLGLGVSGMQSALFLKQKGFEVFASDGGDSPALKEKVRELAAAGIEAECGRHSIERILACDWVLISPGIPPAAPVYKALKEKGLPVYSEIEAAAWFCPSSNIVAVTGSSGKTTVSTLMARVLQKTYGKSFLCGNIGNPWIGELSKIGKDDYVVLELSSFQLMHCESFRPKLGVLLNLSPNHQDWHPDMQDYANAKLRIFKNQQAGDFALIRKKDREAFFKDFKFAGRVYEFDRNPSANPNEDVVRLAARLLGCPDSAVDEVLKSFEGIEHRLEKAAEAGGVLYVNDSKCTTTASLCWALEKYPEGKVLLLAGGHPKCNDFADAKALVARKVRKAFLIGEAKPLLREAWQGACALQDTEDFESAVAAARAEAKPGDIVLLSPACASFDMFKNYMERGRLFKQVVGFLTRPEAASQVR